jgi:hypothetical protein
MIHGASFCEYMAGILQALAGVAAAIRVPLVVLRKLFVFKSIHKLGLYTDLSYTPTRSFLLW